jgi:Na+/melibiose symporter-like transporter
MDGIKGVADMTDVMRGDLASFFLPAYCGLYFLAIYLISKYKIDRKQHQTNLEALAKKQ